MVDDGSSDDSYAICQAVASEDSRVKVVHKVNEGAGPARNAGIDAATGEYVWFFDIDDRVDLTLVQDCLAEMERTRADVMIFGFSTYTPALGVSDEVRFSDKLYESNEQLKQGYVDDILLASRHGNGFVWNKMYRREVLVRSGVRFPSLRIQQDEVFNLRLYPHLQRVFISSLVPYHYYIYNTINTASKYIPLRYEIYRSVDEAFGLLQTKWLGDDKRMTDYRERRLVEGIITELTVNLFRRMCPFSGRRRIARMLEIIDDCRPLLLKADREHFASNLEQRAYISLAASRNPRLLVWVCRVYRMLRKATGRFYNKN